MGVAVMICIGTVCYGKERLGAVRLGKAVEERRGLMRYGAEGWGSFGLEGSAKAGIG